MNCDLQLPKLGRYTPPQKQHPYTSSLSSSASSSSSSVFSVDAASQTSSNSTLSTHSINISWEGEDSWACSGQAISTQVPQTCNWNPASESTACSVNAAGVQRRASAQGVSHTLRHKLTIRTTDIPVPAEQRQHPRRCSINQRPPPPLVRQTERKLHFVDNLVDSATQMVEVIWPLSVPTSRTEGASGRGVLPLRTFIQETLRRSRTSYSTLQVALYYLVLIKPHVPKHDFTMEQPEDVHSLRALQCGRRMFLAALILASKYLQDRNYSAKAWSKISGLRVCEINTNEMAFLQAVRWNLHIKESKWERWQDIVLRYTPAGHPPPSPETSPIECGVSAWKAIVPLLTPELDTVDVNPRTPLRLRRSDFRAPVSSPLSACPPRSYDVTLVPFKVAQFLEPRPDIASLTPPLARLGPLPTPQLTPQSAVATTPAAGVASAFGSRRPSMCAAMAQAQNASIARSAVDSWMPMARNTGLEAYQLSGRRPSLAPSTSSLSSSPESMISDKSSRSSRASSISSVSSSTWAPHQARLARLATCRNARLPYPPPQKQQESAECAIASDIMSSPDFDNFNLDDMTASPLSITLQKLNTPGTVRRKRSRSSMDLSSQPDATQLLKSQPSFDLNDTAFDYASMSNICNSILPDPNIAQSFLLHSSNDRTPCSTFSTKALQSPSRSILDRRVPVQKDSGRKRACCATEATEFLRRPGPGMWEGIL